MPSLVVATSSDTLCTLAIAAGFLNCQRLRDEPGNSDLLDRPLQDGDLVIIPDLDTGDVQRGTDSEHVFEALNSPPVSIRFVHGSPDKSMADDDTLTVLNISNYVTNKGGANGTQGFPSSTGFDARGNADLDAFKIEIVDPAAGGAVKAVLEALKPVYAKDPLTGTLSVIRVEPFTGAEHDRRKLDPVQCSQVSGARHRSPYLRLVVDDEEAQADKKTLPKQTLLVTDMADGLGTGAAADNDTVEILDQQVRASYVIKRCPAADPNKCTVTAQLPIGEDRKRIKIAIHVVRANVGDGALGIGGITEQMVRKRAMKWFRRLYAQAGMGPRFVGPAVDFVDPPEDNMLVLSDETGFSSLGFSSLSFTLSTSPPPPPGSPPDPVVTVALPFLGTPGEVGGLIVAALPAGFVGTSFVNSAAFNAVDGSCDVLITRADGKRVTILNETTDDAMMTVTVARVNVAAVAVTTGNSTRDNNIFLCSTPDHRRIVRQAPGTADRLDFYVVGDLTGPVVTPGVAPASFARGLAMLVGKDLAAPFTSVPPIQFGALLAQRVMDASDSNPFSFPHEAGHVLLDSFHATSGDPLERSQMMRNGTSVTNIVTGSKRICDNPALCAYDVFDPAQPTVGAALNPPIPKISAVQRLRDRGTEALENF